jgi:hypothetical protein
LGAREGLKISAVLEKLVIEIHLSQLQKVSAKAILPASIFLAVIISRFERVLRVDGLK